jgi:hypothetical protein
MVRTLASGWSGSIARTRAAQRRQHRRRLRLGPDHERHGSRRLLGVGDVHLGPRRSGGGAVADRPRHAHDRPPRRGRSRPAELDPAAERLVTGEESAGEELVDHDNRRSVRAVGIRDRATAQERDAHRFEIAGAHGAVVGDRRSARRVERPALDAERSAEAGPVEGEHAHEAGGADTGQCLEALPHVSEERSAADLVRKARGGHRQLGGEEMPGLEAAGRPLHEQEAAHEQAGAYEEDEGQRMLEHDENRMGPAEMTAHPYPSALAQRITEGESGREEGGQDAEEEAGGERREDGKGEDAAVEGRFVQTRNPGGSQ